MIHVVLPYKVIIYYLIMPHLEYQLMGSMPDTTMIRLLSVTAALLHGDELIHVVLPSTVILYIVYTL